MTGKRGGRTGRRFRDIESLPVELLGRIFQYLPAEERRSLALVSRTFQRVAVDPYHWRTMKISGEGLGSTDNVCQMLRKARFLRQLCIEQRSDTNDLMRCVAKYNRCLTHLVVVACRGHDSQARPSLRAGMMCRLLKNCRKLRSLVSTGQMLLGMEVIKLISSRLTDKRDPLSAATVTCATWQQVDELSTAGGVAMF